MDTTAFIQDGYLFYSQNQAQTAAMERKKIDYLETKIDYARPEVVYQIYEKAIRERIFKSPVGIQYLKQLQEFLERQPGIDPSKLSPIPVSTLYESELRSTMNPVRERIHPSVQKKEKEKQTSFRCSIVINIVLVIAIISMFFITLNSQQPNILNYEKVLTDRYAAWDQELTQREQNIRERERELTQGKFGKDIQK